MLLHIIVWGQLCESSCRNYVRPLGYEKAFELEFIKVISTVF